MEEATELGNYLPLSFKSQKEQEYIDSRRKMLSKRISIQGK